MAIIFNKEINHFPILGNNNYEYKKIDLSIDGNIFMQNKEKWEQFLEDQVKKYPSKVFVGGYLEQRFFYSNKNLFGQKQNQRNIHLGIDLWTHAKTAVYCPIHAKIHSMKYNGQNLDYGHTIILSHDLSGLKFYSLYGHLNDSHIGILKVNDILTQGNKFCEIGDRNQNGNWPPHLHFQIIADLQNQVGDYPGVCSRNDLAFFTKNCPDGSSFIY